MTSITVNLPLQAAASYDILIENGIMSRIGGVLRQRESLFSNVKTFAVIADDRVAEIYQPRVTASLVAAGFETIVVTVPPGEKSKSIDNYFALQNWLAENKITRSDAIIALGGGVVGDLAGFTAATYLRGVPFIQIPTTLLAMVDSSIGGKTGIDIPAGKNLVGAFHQPAMVLCDPMAISSLLPEYFSDGSAEAVKHGMIRSADLLKLLQDTPIRESLHEIIEANIQIKCDIVQKDPFDTGERQLLNFGHTISHAIEKLSRFEIPHGNAVAVGMSIITRAAVRKNFCPPECQSILESLLKKFVLPIQTGFSPKDLYEAALTDKKRMGDTLTEVIPRAIGHCELHKMPVTDLLDWIQTGYDIAEQP